MIRNYTFPMPVQVVEHTPVWFHQLKPGDWFSFTPDLAAAWVMGNHNRAICVKTGTESDFVFASRQKCWLVVADVAVAHRGKTL